MAERCGAASVTGAASATHLRRIIAGAGGAIPVERFMQEALYHSTFGYYAAGVRKIGRDGDFSTSATLHPALGRAIAAWAAADRREARSGRAWHLIELGGGSGDLAAAVLDSIGWWRRRALTYHIVEISPHLRAAQEKRLGRLGRRVCWHPEIGSALQAAQGRAHIFSNEFVDAFPCVQLLLDPAGGDWREVCVGWPEDVNRPQESFREWLRQDNPGHAPAGFPPGQRIEMHLSYRRWLESWRHLWQSGRMLTIDYGDETAALYHRRPQGTLRAYCRHQRLNGLEIYERFGQQDLTADVNFSDLQRWGRELGLATKSLLTQRAFLMQWLPARVLRRAAADPRLHFLMSEDGAGGAFKVLEQSVL
jgi:SAM-dependent MidA family methyltransferase